MKTDKVECDEDERKQKIILCHFSDYEKDRVSMRSVSCQEN